ncbi:hypothetical protein C5167_031652 [Papaver somniferum]|uniref:Uncharacterized protein n=1 Tax=Papaver somniferum TaxID=3469 RepID=A0A4Y7K7V3_PAPSO|nr:hypothetical protein C5167_031652 [Papaver somniferum]
MVTVKVITVAQKSGGWFAFNSDVVEVVHKDILPYCQALEKFAPYNSFPLFSCQVPDMSSKCHYLQGWL